MPNLPDLPKKYDRKESKVDDKVANWFLLNYEEDVTIEVKIKGNKVLEHQENALIKVKEGKFKYKIPDMGKRNPFDYIVLKKAIPFVVTCDGNKCIAINKKFKEIIKFKV